MRTQIIRLALFGAATLVSIAAARAQGTAGPKQKVDRLVSPVSANIPNATDKPAALVNGEMVSMAEVKAVLDLRPYPNTLSAEQVKALRQAAVDLLVDDVLMRQFLGKNAPQVSQAEVAKEMDALNAELKQKNKTLDELLREGAQTLPQLQRDMVAQLQWKAYLVQRLPEEQAKKYYTDNKPFFDKVYVRASHILVKVSGNATTDQKKTLRNKLETIHADIKAGKISFEDAAKKYSECAASKGKGGDVGPFPFKFIVADQIARTTFAMKIGEVSDVVTTEMGYHLLKVTDRTQPKELSTYEAMREAVRQVWAQETELYQQVLAHQRKNSKIEVFLQ